MIEQPRFSLDDLAEEFVGRLRRGERPTIAEYVARVPQLAEDIVELFPALLIMENAGPSSAGNLDSRPYEIGIAPTHLGDYRIIREVGRGGMGIVYEAEQMALSRHVALKILPDRAAHSPRNLVRFRREARSAGRLHHTNIVPVFDIGCESGVHYYAMQFIQGDSLDKVIRELAQQLQMHSAATRQEIGAPCDPPRDELSTQIAQTLLSGELESADNEPLVNSKASPDPASSPGVRSASDIASGSIAGFAPFVRRSFEPQPFFRNTARIGMQAADALAYAHSQRILHRDIKPSNLLLDVQGNVWMTDFGLAKDEDEQLTNTGDVVGTLRYLAPERFTRAADARSDIFSLGVTLYELITLQSGRFLEQRSSTTPVQAHGLIRPRKIDPRIPKDLETIILKAVSREPDLRYPHAAEMADDLRRYLSDRPIRARRATWVEQFWLWCRRNPSLAGTAAVAGVLLVLSCFGWMATHVSRRERDTARRAETSALVHEHLAKATYYCTSPRQGGRQRALAEIQQAVRLDPNAELRAALRDQAVAALAINDTFVESIPLTQFQPPPGKISFEVNEPIQIAAISSDYRLAAVNSLDRKAIAIMDLLTRTVLTEQSLAEPFRNAKFSPRHGLLLVGGSDGESFTVCEAATGKLLLSIPQCWTFDVSGDERWLAVGGEDATVQIVDLQGIEPRRTLPAATRPERVAFGPDWARLAISYGHLAPIVSILDCDSGEVLQPLETGNAGFVRWHPDGKRLIATLNHHIEIWDVDSRKKVWATPDHLTVIESFDLAPDGCWLVDNCWDGRSRLWNVNSPTEDGLRIERKVTINWNSRSDLIGWRLAESGIELVHFDRSPILETLPTANRYGDIPFTVTFSPDGQRALTSFSLPNGIAQSQMLNCWDVSSRELIGICGVNFSACRETPDGRFFSMVHDDLWARFPVGEETDETCPLGPPVSIRLSSTPFRAAISADGLTCTALRDEQLLVYHWPDNSTEHGILQPRQTIQIPFDHDIFQVSRDGKWAATGFWHSPTICVWDLERGRELGKVELGAQSSFWFSPDSQQLVTCRWDAYRFWDLPGLENRFTLPRTDCALPGPLDFDASGTKAVMALHPDSLDIVDLPSGASRLRLHRPNQLATKSHSAAFHPRGAGILTYTEPDFAVVYWDLDALERELDKLGLGVRDDEAESVAAPRAAKQLNFVGIDDWAETEFIGLMSEEQARKHLAVREEAYAANPTALAANNLAWTLLVAPEKLRDVPRALELAEQAFSREKSNQYFVRNTLAMAYCRAGNFEQAIATLPDNLVESADAELAWDLFILSLSYSGLKNEPMARNYYHLGQRWMQQQAKAAKSPILTAGQQLELESIRQEAEKALKALATPSAAK